MGGLKKPAAALPYPDEMYAAWSECLRALVLAHARLDQVALAHEQALAPLAKEIKALRNAYRRFAVANERLGSGGQEKA